MADERDICERLEDPNYDGAVFLRLDAAKEITALRHYVARLEDELAEEQYQHGRTIIKLENAQEHISDQALDIVMLGQEVGRLREALQLGVKMRAAQCTYFSDRTRNNLIASKQVEEEFDAISRAALAEQTGFNEPTPHKPQYPFEIKSSADRAEKEKG